MTTQSEVLAYARQVITSDPHLPREALRVALCAKFVDDAKILLAAGADRSPFDWLLGLQSILRGIRRLLLIDGVVRTVGK